MKLNTGTSIIEFLLYLTITTFIVINLFAWMGGLQTTFLRMVRSVQQEHARRFAQDLLLKDLQQAPADRASFKLIKQDQIIWSALSGAIGWTVQKNKLMRMIGTYDVQKGSWQSRKSAVILQPVQKISFSFVKKLVKGHEFIYQIQARITCQADKEIVVQTRVRNGELL